MSELVEKRIISKLTQAGQGISVKELQRDFRDVDSKLLSDILRTLMETRKVTIQQLENSSERFITLVNNLAEGLALVFEIIRASGCEGIDQTAICTKAKLSKSEVVKALNQLTAQQRIKDIRCFTNKAKKLYMLFELEPSEAVTGGTFYNEMRDIDVPFVDSLRSRIVSFVASRKVVSSSQITQLLTTDLTMAGKRLSSREVQTLVNTLEMDGVIECISNTSRDQQYQLAFGKSVTRFSVPETFSSVVGQFPCVGCPQLDQCSAHGVGAVSPVHCTYLSDWLRLD